jgi:hypothetical protein
MRCHVCREEFLLTFRFIRHAVKVHGLNRGKMMRLCYETPWCDLTLVASEAGKFFLLVQPSLPLDAPKIAHSVAPDPLSPH